jgi:hypothetical protein
MYRGSRVWIADGNHRFHAAEVLDIEIVPVRLLVPPARRELPGIAAGASSGKSGRLQVSRGWEVPAAGLGGQA